MESYDVAVSLEAFQPVLGEFDIHMYYADGGDHLLRNTNPNCRVIHMTNDRVHFDLLEAKDPCDSSVTEVSCVVLRKVDISYSLPTLHPALQRIHHNKDTTTSNCLHGSDCLI